MSADLDAFRRWWTRYQVPFLSFDRSSPLARAGIHKFWNPAILDLKSWSEFGEHVCRTWKGWKISNKWLKRLYLSTRWPRTVYFTAFFATAEKIIAYALWEHDHGSALNWRTSGNLWRPGRERGIPPYTSRLSASIVCSRRSLHGLPKPSSL